MSPPEATILTATIKIERVGREGQGVGFDPDGNIYFVPKTVPGDRVCVSFTDRAGRYRDADPVEWIERSHDRQPSLCRYSEVCGGCEWLHWKYSAQLRAKEEMLRHQLQRLGVTVKEFFPIVPAAKIYAYRTRVQIRQRGSQLGFYKRRSHEIVDIDECRVAVPEINEEIRRLRGEGNVKEARKIELVVTQDGSIQRFTDRPHGAGGFIQIHGEQNEKLKEIVAEEIGHIGGKRVLELYCGNGNLTNSYFQKVERLLGIDNNLFAINEAKRIFQNHENVRFLCQSIRPSLKRQIADTFETLLLDPPRLGTQRMLRYFLNSSIQNIIYVSCSLSGFSYDMSDLKNLYETLRVRPIDMFPHTHHLEFVVTLRRR